MTPRLTIHDVNFAGLFAGSVLGPLDVPPIDRVRAVLVELAERNPRHPVFCQPRIDRLGQGRWVPVSADERRRRCFDMVTELADPHDLDAALSGATRPLGPQQLLEYGVSSTHIVTRRSHTLGDGMAVASLLPELFGAAISGRPVPDLRPRSASFPLLRALAHHFGRQPQRVVDTLREPRPRAVGPAAVVDGDLGTYDAFGRSFPVETMQSLRAWRDDAHPDVSMNNVLVAAVRRAFDTAGVAFTSPGFRMLVNGRRYLPAGVPVAGNFATAIYVEPTDARSPRSVDAVIRSNLESGRPLATMLSSSVKNVVGLGDAPSSGGSLATLTISNLGRQRQVETLPLRSGCEYRGVAQPEPGGITVMLAQVGQRLAASATFAPSSVPRADVVNAIDALTHDPVGLLCA